MKNDKEVRKILLNLDFRVLFKELSFENAGRMLFEVMDKYAEQKELSLEDPTTLAYAKVWCADVDIALKYSRKKSETNSKNGQKGGEQKEENRRKREAEQKQQPELFKEEAASEDDVPLVEAEEVEPYPFERFWNLYNFKHDKQPAEKAWKKLNNKDRAAAMAAIPNYLAYLEHKRSTGFNQNQAYAASYLNKRRWEDDYSITDTPQNNGNNNVQYNNREAQRQQNLREMGEWLAEAAANVQPINPTESGI